MKLRTAVIAAAIVCSPALAMAQSATKDSATANEKPGQGTNTGTMKSDKMMGPQKMAPIEGSSSGASSGTSDDQKAAPPKPSEYKTGPTK